MRQVSLWLTSEGCGKIHYSCGPVDKITELGVRHLAAGTCTAYDTVTCCQEDPGRVCAFDVWDDVEVRDQQVILCQALARAEGRDIGQPWRCAVHGSLTFGGCCERRSA